MSNRNSGHPFFISALVAVSLLLSPVAANAEEVKYRVVGLFMKEREKDLHQVMEQVPNVKLVRIDFDNAEALFEYDVAKAFPGAKPAQVVERLDNLVKNASRHTFGIKPLRTLPLDKLQRIEIPIAGLDCKACCLVAYEAVARIDGVEQATASFRDRRVTALIDPSKVDRGKLVDALRKRGVEVTSP